MTELRFAKLHTDAKIPTKEAENAGYDVYAAFDNEHIIIAPGDTVMVPTGICSAFSQDYVMILKERGSTGTKGMGQRSGVIDSGYRGQWFVPITNHNTDKTIVISREPIHDDNVIYYPYSKAICQAILLPVPETCVVECTPDEIMAVESKRGSGALGSSGK